MNQSQGDQSTWHHSRVALFVHRVALLSSGRISSSSLLSSSPLSSSTMLSPILVQLSLNLRQHVLLIVPLWCFRLMTSGEKGDGGDAGFCPGLSGADLLLSCGVKRRRSRGEVQAGGT